jgi:hypothetical protein
MVVMALINYYTIYKRLLYAGKATIYKACQEAGIKLKGKYEDYFCKPYILSKKTDEIKP